MRMALSLKWVRPEERVLSLEQIMAENNISKVGTVVCCKDYWDKVPDSPLCIAYNRLSSLSMIKRLVSLLLRFLNSMKWSLEA